MPFSRTLLFRQDKVYNLDYTLQEIVLCHDCYPGRIAEEAYDSFLESVIELRYMFEISDDHIMFDPYANEFISIDEFLGRWGQQEDMSRIGSEEEMIEDVTNDNPYLTGPVEQALGRLGHQYFQSYNSDTERAMLNQSMESTVSHWARDYDSTSPHQPRNLIRQFDYMLDRSVNTTLNTTMEDDDETQASELPEWVDNPEVVDLTQETDAAVIDLTNETEVIDLVSDSDELGEPEQFLLPVQDDSTAEPDIVDLTVEDEEETDAMTLFSSDEGSI